MCVCVPALRPHWGPATVLDQQSEDQIWKWGHFPVLTFFSLKMALIHPWMLPTKFYKGPHFCPKVSFFPWTSLSSMFENVCVCVCVSSLQLHHCCTVSGFTCKLKSAARIIISFSSKINYIKLNKLPKSSFDFCKHMLVCVNISLLFVAVNDILDIWFQMKGSLTSLFWFCCHFVGIFLTK